MINLYKQELLDHYKYPRNFGVLDLADVKTAEHNPSCGDSVQIYAQVHNGTSLSKLSFEGKGCVISQAAASMLTENCANKHIDAVLAMTAQEMIQLLGIEFGPTRLKCALLPLITLQKGLKEFRARSCQTAQPA